MIEWSETHETIRSMIRKFLEAEVEPKLDELEHGDLPPYDILRKMLKTFGVDVQAKDKFQKRIANEKAIAAGEAKESEEKEKPSGGNDAMAMQMILISELCRFCPGMVTAMGVSMGLTGAAIMSKGTIAQKERWALPVLTFEKIGSWAITEPGSGSDAFGSMRSTAKLREDGNYVLKGNKTYITNGPFADTIVFICKFDEPGVAEKDRKTISFILDSGMEGLTQSKPFRKMGIHSSPTGELFLDDVIAGPERLMGESVKSADARSGAKDTFAQERSGVAAMASGIINRCMEISVQYAKEREQFGQPIAQFQLIQDKIAKMEIARINVQNMLFNLIEKMSTGKSLSLGEASAIKLYCSQAAVEVANHAIQILGGNGYMAEYRVEQLARDARILQIYGGTDELQTIAIAKDLIRRDSLNL